MDESRDLIAANKRLPSAKVFAGVAAYHFIIISKDGRTFAFGLNDSGQLALGDFSFRNKPTEVKVFSSEGKFLSQAACGRQHTLFLSTTGKVYSCGSNRHGELGIQGAQDRSLPEHVVKLSKESVKHVCCGDFFSSCLTRKGDVFLFGNNDYGQIGDSTTINRNIPVLLKLPNDHKVTKISLGYGHTVLSTDAGSVITFGCNDDSQLGRKGKSGVPGYVESLPSKKAPLQVLCGGSHTTYAMSPSEIYSVGFNASGALGIGNDVEQQVATKVKWFHDKKIEKMSIGGTHTICKLNDNRLVSYGYNMFYQLCSGDKYNRYSPEECIFDASGGFKAENVIDIVCSDICSFLITHDGLVYSCGCLDTTSTEGIMYMYPEVVFEGVGFEI